MRFALLLLVPTLAHADTRFGVHVGGGLEGGLIQGEPRPDAVAEAGLSVDYFRGRAGVGVVLERVGRLNEGEESAGEHKVDVLIRLVHRNVVGGLGMGIRKLAIEGGVGRPGSTVWGVDLMRMNVEVPITRGRVSLEFYFAWTFGLYKGEIYGERFGDMAYPTRDFTTVTSAYVLGLQTSFHTH